MSSLACCELYVVFVSVNFAVIWVILRGCIDDFSLNVSAVPDFHGYDTAFEVPVAHVFHNVRISTIIAPVDRAASFFAEKCSGGDLPVIFSEHTVREDSTV